MEGLFAPSLLDVLGMSFMAAYLSSPACFFVSVKGLQGSGPMGGTIPASPLVGGVRGGGQLMGVVSLAWDLVSVGGLLGLGPMEGIVPTSSCVGGMGTGGQPMGHLPCQGLG